jgi:hypothetical protein
MKKYILSAFAALALSCTFVACGDDNDDPNISYDTTAAQGSAGTYSGTWTRTGDDGTTSYSGTITLAAASDANATNVTFSCPEADLNATSLANVWHSNYGFQFFNQTVSSANGLGVAFSGRIDESGNLISSFTLSQKVGRKNYEFKYEFIGKK